MCLLCQKRDLMRNLSLQIRTGVSVIERGLVEWSVFPGLTATVSRSMISQLYIYYYSLHSMLCNIRKEGKDEDEGEGVVETDSGSKLFAF